MESQAKEKVNEKLKKRENNKNDGGLDLNLMDDYSQNDDTITMSDDKNNKNNSNNSNNNNNNNKNNKEDMIKKNEKNKKNNDPSDEMGDDWGDWE